MRATFAGVVVVVEVGEVEDEVLEEVVVVVLLVEELVEVLGDETAADAGAPDASRPIEVNSPAPSRQARLTATTTRKSKPREYLIAPWVVTLPPSDPATL